MTTDEQRRERHRDAMRRIDEMNNRLRDVGDDYVRMREQLERHLFKPE
jgi:hypothetical protein